MPTLTPVEHDPFSVTLQPVEHDPFAPQALIAPPASAPPAWPEPAEPQQQDRAAALAAMMGQ